MDMFAHLSYKQRQDDLITHDSPEEELTYRAGQIMNTVRVTFVDLFQFYQNVFSSHLCKLITYIFHLHCRWMESMKTALKILVQNSN